MTLAQIYHGAFAAHHGKQVQAAIQTHGRAHVYHAARMAMNGNLGALLIVGLNDRYRAEPEKILHSIS